MLGLLGLLGGMLWFWITCYVADFFLDEVDR